MNGGGALRGTEPAVGTLTLRRAARPAEPVAASATVSGRQCEAAELLRLAERFAGCEPEQAHELFTDAFGLYGARHFGTAPRPGDGDLVAVSWWHGPTVRHSVPRARRGRRQADGSQVAAPRRSGGRHRKADAEAALATERRAAARMLLAHPLVTATGPHAQAFALIHRHAQWLTERFAELLGYPLIVSGSFARLVKTPLGAGAQRGLGSFTPRGYAALAAGLSVLLLGPQRWPVGQLAARIAESISPTFEASDAEAIDLAIDLLTEWQVLSRAAGEEWVGVDHALAAALAAGCRPARPQDPPVPRTTIPVAVRRRLAESPVLLLADLTALEREWLLESRQREIETFADFLGLATEIRSEGFALLDPADELTDLRLPGPDTLAHAALLLVERLVDQLRPLPAEPAPVGVPIAEALIDGILGDVADECCSGEHGADADWRRAHLADRAAFRREVLDLLHRMRLIAPAAADGPGVPARTGWTLLAPAARYAAELNLQPAPGTGRHSRKG
ncbi:DUF2398 family protein [Kitasatospora azatica]|uniref:DUF2398 family protein n=1 Tax=Kitasatospora azatica TaxID=58347 RepID=UPI00068DC894|nr:DUF2398 family protein [Kitasatospora azatica]